ncbi:MAG TPA: dicarboxylate/amino acid:cation symporter [Pseudomonadales bacterium]
MKLALHWQILIAILLAAMAGTFVEPDTTVAGIAVPAVFAFLGTLFMNALLMIIVPLIMASIICGMASIGDAGHLGRMGGKTLAFYLLSSLLAILTGLLLVNVIHPGEAGLVAPVDDLALAASVDKVAGKSSADIIEIFIRMVPPNIVEAAAEGQMLGLIFFSLLFGFFVTRLEAGQQQLLLGFWQGVQQVMLMMTMLIMKFAPLGVFGLVAKTLSETGLGLFASLLGFFVTVALALLVHMFINMAVLLKVAGISPWQHYRAMREALLTAFSTASSAATLPLTLKAVEQGAGVSNSKAAFVLPLGATVNMDGTALYECVAAMFIAQVYGLELTIATQFTIVVIALLTSIGVAGIPAASLVAIAIILTAVGLPLEGIGLLLVTDRLLDMMRTAVNVFGDSCAAVIIARSEGENVYGSQGAG